MPVTHCDGSHLGLVNMSANNSAVAFAQGHFCSGKLKVTHVLHRLFHGILDGFAERILLAPHALEEHVEPVVQPDEQVIRKSAQLGQPTGILNARVKNISMKYPGADSTKSKNHLVAQVDPSEVRVGKAPQHFVMVARDVENLGAFLGHGYQAL